MCVDYDSGHTLQLERWEDFKEYSRIHLPLEVESKLEALFPENLVPQLKTSLGDAVNASLSVVYDNWQNERSRSLPSVPSFNEAALQPADQPAFYRAPHFGFQDDPPALPGEIAGFGLNNPSALYPSSHPVEPSDSGYFSQQQPLQTFNSASGLPINDFFQQDFPAAQTEYNQADFVSSSETGLGLNPSEWQLNMAAFHHVQPSDVYRPQRGDKGLNSPGASEEMLVE